MLRVFRVFGVFRVFRVIRVFRVLDHSVLITNVVWCFRVFGGILYVGNFVFWRCCVRKCCVLENVCLEILCFGNFVCWKFCDLENLFLEILVFCHFFFRGTLDKPDSKIREMKLF